MALVQLSGIISNIKGSIGGTTFSNNRAGITAKKRITQSRSLNSKQAAELNNSIAVTVAWNALTYSQKNVFNLYALANAYTDRYGVVKTLTGFQWFKQLSQASNYFTGSQLTSPPAYSVPPAIPTFTVTLNPTTIILDWSTPINPALINIYCYTTPPVKAQAQVQRSAYRLTDIRSVDYTSSFDITDKWNDAHGMDYASLAASGLFNISVLMYAIDTTSFNNGTAQTANGHL
jgi:hypothetical protein